METIVQNISQILGVTVIHSLWQGLLIYLVLQFTLALLPKLKSAAKHNLSFGALLLMAGWFVLTLINEATLVNWQAAAPAGGAIPYLPKYLNISEQSYRQYQYALDRYLPYIAVIYIAGLLFNSLKLFLAWNHISQVKRSLDRTSTYNQTVEQLSSALKLTKKAGVYFSELIDVPGTIGYLKPIILLPVSLSANLSAAEVEAILLHELAHIKRNDYLLNMIQQIISVVLFYNPFTMLINRGINIERENCCDDEVVAITGEPLVYARALLKLEQQKQNNLQLALAATGKKHLLLNRIERIMTTKKLTINVRHTLAALLLFTFSLGSIAWFNPQIKNKTLIVNTEKPEFVQQLLGDTVPAKKRVAKTKPDVAAKKSIVRVNGRNVVVSNDPELERLGAEIDKHSAFISKFYESGEFRNLTTELEKNGEALDAYYNSPELKALTNRQEKVAEELESLSNNPELAKLNNEIESLSKFIDSYYNSAEFKTLQKNLDIEGAKLGKLKPASDAFEQQAKKVDELSNKITALSNSTKIKEQTNQLHELSLKLHQYYESESYKKVQNAMRAVSDSLHKAYGLKSLGLKQDNMRLLSQKLQAYQNNRELKLHQEEMKKATLKLQNYLKSDAYQQKLKKILAEQAKAGIDTTADVDNIVSPEF
ncbi:M48 family metalloprotease [Mucilaginibacter roseus]|uniref:M48 family metalloprotease n=1 Tax=Mucilaginibacter roseus TaxID=1528868 RepID=A0ABS8U744_9SPHI|nr:M56 family metallopeptidase [Mucilaginibacter roseus]MCD8742492.1 M48 family metalloprotease [Mucilaginibacter roseus]